MLRQRMRFVIHFVMLIITPSLLAYPQNHLPQTSFQVVSDQSEQNELHVGTRPLTYDEILNFIDEIESGELEKKCSPEQLDQVNQFVAFLAKKGWLPKDSDEELALEEDIEDLLANPFEYAFYSGNSQEYVIVPAICSGDLGYDFVQCGWISKSWKKTKEFVKKHKKAIIIGAMVVVAVVAIVASSTSSPEAVSAAAGAAGAATSAASSETNPSCSESPSQENSSVPNSSQDIPIFTSIMDEQITSFKETISEEGFFDSSDGQNLSIEETGRILGPLFAHQSVNHFDDHLSSYPEFSQEIDAIKAQINFSVPPETGNHSGNIGHYDVDRSFSTDYGPIASRESNFNALAYKMRGEKALEYGYYDQAVHDLDKAIDLNPADPMPYLHRSASHFNMGEYDRSLEDFQEFAAQDNQISSTLPAITDFRLGFAKGATEGVCESGKGLLLFMKDCVSDPVHTSKQVISSVSSLVELARNDEWGIIAEALVPEVCQLVQEWDTLSPSARGELVGHAIGKHGGDIIIPGTMAKVASKSVKSAKKLATIGRRIKTANETLVLETAAGIGDAAKVGEIVQGAQKTAWLADELGFSTREMGMLKKTGNLESTVTSTYEHLSLPTQQSIKLFKHAREKLKPYQGKYMSEFKVRELIHETGLPAFARPKNIPKNFKVRLSDKPGGMKYVHPENNHTYVRVMPGKPHSKYPHQRNPYVNHRVNGQSVDKFGNKVLNDSVEAHIPVNEFIYRELK